jgi:Lrp/AsnC family transcriptional regulator, leucine-responsive regulatory protein
MAKGGNQSMADEFVIDEADRAIIDELRANGRATNQQIADRLDLTAATVSARIRRMEDANKLRVVAVSDFSAHGYNVLLEVAIEVDNRPASEVVAELAELPEVFAAHLVTGRYDIDLLVVLHDFDELPNLLLNKISKIRGIHSITPSIAVDIVKYKFDVAPIEAREDV